MFSLQQFLSPAVLNEFPDFSVTGAKHGYDMNYLLASRTFAKYWDDFDRLIIHTLSTAIADFVKYG